MAPLTWRNVDAPNFGQAASILDSVSRNLGNAGAGIGDAFRNIHESQRRNRSADAIAALARVANEGDVNAALGQAEGMVAPMYRSDELIQAMANLRGTALGYDKSRADTDQVRASTGLTHANTARVRGVEGRDAQTHEIGLRRDAALGNLTNMVANRRLGSYGAGDPTIGGVSPELESRWIQQESSGDPNAVSEAGAVGLTQIMPNTARDPGYGLPNIFDMARASGRNVPDESDATLQRLLRDPDLNLAFGRAYRDRMIEQNGGDVALGLAAYNAGPGAVQSAGGVPNYRETQNYVRNILGDGSFDWSQGGVLRPDDILGLIDDNYTSYKGAREAHDAHRTTNESIASSMLRRAIDAATEEDRNRNSDYAFGRTVLGDQRADAAWERDEQARIIQEQADNYFYDLIAQDPAAFLDPKRAEVAIAQNQEIPPEQKPYYLERFREFVTNNGNLFGEDDTLDQPNIDLLRSQLDLQQQYRDATDVDQRLLGNILAGARPGSSGGSGGGDAASGSGSAPSGEGGESPLDTADRILNMEGAQIGATTSDITDLINWGVDTYGLPYDVVASAVERTFGGRLAGSGRAYVNRNRLGRELALATDRERAQAAINTSITNQVRRAEIEMIESRIETLNQQERALAWRQIPEDHPSRRAIQEQREALQDQASRIVGIDRTGSEEAYSAELDDMAGTAAGLPEVAAPEPPEGAQASASAPNLAAISISEALARGEQTPTPSGTAVDPKSSGLAQAIARSARAGEVGELHNRLRERLEEVAGSGQADVTDSLRNFFDWARMPPEEAQARAEAREARHAETRRMRAWFFSQEVRDMLAENPQLYTEAIQDPEGFYRRFARNR